MTISGGQRSADACESGGGLGGDAGFYFVEREAFDEEELVAGLLAAMKGDVTRAQGEDFGDVFDEGCIGFAIDGRCAEAELENGLAGGVGGEADDGVGAGAGLEVDGEMGDEGWHRVGGYLRR